MGVPDVKFEVRVQESEKEKSLVTKQFPVAFISCVGGYKWNAITLYSTYHSDKHTHVSLALPCYTKSDRCNYLQHMNR